MQIALKNTHTHTARIYEFSQVAGYKINTPQPVVFVFTSKLRKQLHLNIENKIIGNN